ncbi:MAG: hypothetical protein MJ252_23840 [archaeon]|nr:hypothetical protein [archaeon]
MSEEQKNINKNIPIPNEETRLDEEDLDNPSYKPESLEILQSKNSSDGLQNNINRNNNQEINCCGLGLRKIGKMYAFGFNSLSEPKYVIGPHWYMYLIMNCLIVFISTFVYSQLLGRVLPLPLKIIYGMSIIFLMLIYFYNFIRNPGISINNVNQSSNAEFCQICHSFIEAGTHTVHCNFCNVCIKGFDHHCVWIGKCVGYNNLYTFYFLLFSVAVVYILIFGTAIYYGVSMFRNS